MENKTIEEVRKNLEESGDVHLQAIARLDHDRLVKLADWIRSLDKEQLQTVAHICYGVSNGVKLNQEGDKTMTDTSYNGWTNYPTWRVNLEIFDGWDDIAGGITPESLEEIANEILDMGGSDHSTTLDFARSFISDVNWHEIAEHLNENMV